ncbi:MAG: response regulator, partial [Spirochaetia bacterium]|nr:response regulator [Spirochaetia bacterium]
MRKILIADDNNANRYFLEALFKGEGYETILAKDGVGALELARKYKPDAIITDILMPVMDGFELCRIWKSDAELKNIPFIVYTATYTEPKDEQLMMKLGADRFLIKPMQPESMAEAVREVLAQDKPPRQPEISGDEMEGLKRYNEVLFHKLEQKISQLENEVSERRKAEEKLLKTVDALVRTSAELDKFSAASYHDLQEPLRMITSYLQLLEKRLEGKLDNETSGYINTVIEGAKHMSTLVKGIIDYSKVDKLEDRYEKVDMDSLADSVIAGLKNDKKYASASINKAPLPRVMGSKVK